MIWFRFVCCWEAADSEKKNLKSFFFIWYIRGSVFRSCAYCSQLNLYLIFWSVCEYFVSWCLVPCTVLIYDLIWLLIVSFAAWNLPIAKNVWFCFFDAIIIKAGKYVVTNFRSYASFSELHCYPIIWNLAVICFWIFFGRFLWFGPIVSIVVSCCLMSCTFLINDLVLFCCLEAADS